MRSDASPSVAIYVHVPFCRARCTYCDFNTYVGLDHLLPAYVAALCREIEIAARRWGPLAVSTVYLGGGTPSVLPLELLAGLTTALASTFHVSDNAEITIEANPGTLTLGYLRGLRTLGVSRLSLGVQSAHDDELEMLGRIHSWNRALDAIRWAREAGFINLNLDLIFGIPGQTMARWQETLEAVLDLNPEHLSLYDLSIEEGTPLERRIADRVLPTVDEDRSAAMYELAEELLARAGFFHYEISSWARMDHRLEAPKCGWSAGPRFQHLDRELSEEVSAYVCRHNLNYWRNEPWLGLGAGAHSWVDSRVLSHAQTRSTGSSQAQSFGPVPTTCSGLRWANTAHPHDYIVGHTTANHPVAEAQVAEEIGHRLEMGETMMLGLRLAEGVHAERFEARFQVPLGQVFGDELRDLHALGLLAWDGAVARLTARGRLLGNHVFARFV